MLHIKSVVKLIRPKQWIKNTFVLLPVFFGGMATNPASLSNSLLVFVIFCLVASAIYCLNDIFDMEDDRSHPVKCHRPLASGAIHVSQALMMVVLFSIAALLLLFLLPIHRGQVAMAVGCYYVLNVAYCLRLKDYAVIDVCIIAVGFVLRILAGGEASGVVVSRWLVLMTFLLTLFLSFAKRRDDVLRMNETGKAPRKNTVRYNLTFINQAITITASVTLVCYIMYTVSPEVMRSFGTEYLYLTTIFVVLGLLRYIQIAVVDEKSGDPTKVIWSDRFIQLTVLGWGITFLLLIYFKAGSLSSLMPLF